jgi:predicted lipid-binding transport protein (Tim44 family)
MIKKIFKISAALFAVFLITTAITEQYAYARAGGGRSSGSRGSRSSSQPSTPSRQSQQPSRESKPPDTQPGGGFLRTLGTGIAGGFLGSMLFRGLGLGSSGGGDGQGGGQGGGIGLFEILILGGIGYMLFRFYKKRKEGSGGGIFAGSNKSDLSAIKTSGPSFDETGFNDNVLDMFFKIQAAWMNRNLSSVKSLLTDEMRNTFQSDIDSLLSSNKINRLENIAVRSVEITESWQESEQDYITALIYANILDYTVDEKSGEVVGGSKTEPTKFEEYWTFTRPSQTNNWKLSAINQA